MATIESCILNALGSGSISQQEADAPKQRYAELEDVARSSPNGKSAQSMLSDELFAKRENQKRLDLLTVKAQDQIAKDVRSYAMGRGDRGSDLVGAMVRMFENFGDAGFSSVRGIGSALLAQAHSEMADLLHTFRRSALTMGRFNRPMLNDVVKAAFGEGTTPEAKALYESFTTVAEKLRRQFNEAGGSVKWRTDWGLPQEHNPSAVMRGTVEGWSDFISSRLDWAKMTDPFIGLPIQSTDRPAFLEGVWNAIVSNGWDERDPSMTRGATALANMRADPRFLKFKDSQSWLDYNKAYGSGDVFATMMSHVNGLTRDVALLQRLGPNPAATVEWMKQLLQREAAQVKIGRPSLLDATPMTADWNAWKASRQLDGLYDIAKGSSVPESFLGTGVGIARNIAYSAKIGSAVITHTFSNTIIQAMSRYLHGLPVLNTGLDILKGFTNGQEMLQAGVLAEDALHTMELSAREQGAGTKLREMSAWMPAWTTHYSGLNAVVTANKRAFGGSMMATFASNLDRPFGEIKPRLQQYLSGYGISATDWEVMRLANTYEPDRGAPFLRWREIAQTGVERAGDVSRILGQSTVDPLATAKASEAIAMKYLEMMHGGTEVAVPTSNWRARAMMVGDTKPGTLAGEAVRSAMMFKAGFMATFMLTQKDMILRELAANKASTAAYVGASAIGLTIAGLMTLQVKNLINGKDLLPMDPETEQGRATWGQAALTSGAAGIYGDFIVSDRSSYGHDLLSTMAGPVLTGAEDALHGIHSAVSDVATAATGGKMKKPLDDEAEDGAIKMLRNNTPVLSTHWALRAAYNRVILDQLQSLADPSAHKAMRKMERKIQSETGQEFYWPRGEMLPERLPQLTEARH